MAGRLVIPQYMPAEDGNRDAIPGAKLFVYVNETTALAITYTTDALTTPNPNPIIANDAGVFPPIWAADESVFSVAVTTNDGAPLVAYDGVEVTMDADTAAVILAEAAAASALASAGAAAADLAAVQGLVAGALGATGGVRIYTINSPGDTIYANPVDGGTVIIDNVIRRLTQTISKPITGLSLSTVYYCYIYWTGTGTALEFSTTGHVASAGLISFPGVEVKNGDPTRTLVGMFYVHSDGKVKMGVSNGTVISWYKRQPFALGGLIHAQIEGVVSTQAPPWQELGTTTQNKVLFLSWGPYLGVPISTHIGISGSAQVSTVGGKADFVFGTTALGPSVPVSSVIQIPYTGAAYTNASGHSTISLSEGLHEMNFWGRVYGAYTASIYVNTEGQIWG